MSNQVVFSYPGANLRMETSIVPPKRYTDLDAWYAVCVKRFATGSQILNLRAWTVTEEIVSPGTIIFKLTNKDGQVASLTIVRKGIMSKN